MAAITIKSAQEAHPLARAVLRQLGGGREAVQSAKEAAEHGADGGFGGFIYYKDTCAFTKRHRASIAEAVKEMADDLGEKSAIQFVRSFNCLDDDTPEQAVALALYGGRVPQQLRDDVDLVENALAWFALEEVGRAIEDQEE